MSSSANAEEYYGRHVQHVIISAGHHRSYLEQAVSQRYEEICWIMCAPLVACSERRSSLYSKAMMVRINKDG